MFSFSFCFLLVVQRDISLLLFVTFKFRVHFLKMAREPYIPLYNVPIDNTNVISSRKHTVHANCYKWGAIQSKEKLLQLKAPVTYLHLFLSLRVLVLSSQGKVSRKSVDFQNNSRKLCQRQIQTGVGSHVQLGRLFIKDSCSESDYFP